MEKRKSNRFNALNEMKGKLYNVVNFLVKNISKEGLNLISNFQPIIGSSHKIFLFNTTDGSQMDFEIEINSAQVESFTDKKYAALSPGLLYSIGASFNNLNEEQQEFLTRFLKKKSADPEQGFISKDNINQHS
jgi:hypothetical protein